MGSEPLEIAKHAAALDEVGVPYVHATVVRAQSPTSSRAGATAIVRSDGSLEGFIGGQCADGSVRAAALEALETGESVLLRILPDDASQFPDAPGAHTVVNPCLSGGAIEVFLEPRLPTRRLAVIGRSPITTAIVDLAGPLGFHVGQYEEPPDDLRGMVAVLISSHGRHEQESIRAALDAGVGFVGLVASTKRGGAVLAELNLDGDERRRVHTPVGIYIGAQTPAEIALSILAAVISGIRVDGLVAPASPAGAADPVAAPAEPATALDPICGMTVVASAPTLSVDDDGDTVWFCNPGCRDEFMAQRTTP